MHGSAKLFISLSQKHQKIFCAKSRQRFMTVSILLNIFFRDTGIAFALLMDHKKRTLKIVFQSLSIWEMGLEKIFYC
jgi:hypothetical protein